jgi:hypothetical protein
MDTRDQDAAELLSALLEELRRMREETNALLEEILRKLEDIRLNI